MSCFVNCCSCFRSLCLGLFCFDKTRTDSSQEVAKVFGQTKFHPVASGIITQTNSCWEPWNKSMVADPKGISNTQLAVITKLYKQSASWSLGHQVYSSTGESNGQTLDFLEDGIRKKLEFLLNNVTVQNTLFDLANKEKRLSVHPPKKDKGFPMAVSILLGLDFKLDNPNKNVVKYKFVQYLVTICNLFVDRKVEITEVSSHPNDHLIKIQEKGDNTQNRGVVLKTESREVVLTLINHRNIIMDYFSQGGQGDSKTIDDEGNSKTIYELFNHLLEIVVNNGHILSINKDFIDMCYQQQQFVEKEDGPEN